MNEQMKYTIVAVGFFYHFFYKRIYLMYTCNLFDLLNNLRELKDLIVAMWVNIFRTQITIDIQSDRPGQA